MSGGASTAYRDTRHVPMRNTGFGYSLRDSLLTDLYSGSREVFDPEELVKLCERVEREADEYYEGFVSEKMEEQQGDHDSELEERDKRIKSLEEDLLTEQNRNQDLEHKVGQFHTEVAQLEDQLQEAKSPGYGDITRVRVCLRP